MSTVTNAIAKTETGPTAIVSQYEDTFAAVLPSHVKPAAWIRLAQGVLRRDKNLYRAAEADPASLVVALADAARQGLDPGTEQFYLTPRKVKGKSTVLGIRGYQGEIELIYRAGAVSSVIVEVVRQSDRFTYSPGRDERPVHEIDWDAADRGPLRLVYAYAIMKDGATSKVVVLNKRHIADARKMSQGSDSEYSPWQRHEEAMWLKTAAHRLTKWVPTSAEYRKEQLRAEAEVAAEPRGEFAPNLPDGDETPTLVPAGDGSYIDGEIIDAPDLSEWPEAAVPGGAV